MIQALRGRLDGQRPGQSLVILAASLTVLMGMTALSVDAGNLWLQQRLLQNLADGAALVGAQEYDNTTPTTPLLSPMGPVSALTYVQRGGIACTDGVNGPDCRIKCSIAPTRLQRGGADHPIPGNASVGSTTVSFAFARISASPAAARRQGHRPHVRQTPDDHRPRRRGRRRVFLNSVNGGDADDRFRSGAMCPYDQRRGVDRHNLH
jgi:hypothetical protein